MSMSRPFMDYLPDYYQGVIEMEEIAKAVDIKIEEIENAILDTLNQAHIETATWGLAKWEKDLAVTTIEGKPLDQRRSVLIAKRRGYGKVSASMLKSVAESYENGRIDVVVYYLAGQIDITFNDNLGTPPNIQDVMNAINQIKPAHYGVAYHYRYLRVAEVHSMTVADLHKTLIDKFAFTSREV